MPEVTSRNGCNVIIDPEPPAASCGGAQGQVSYVYHDFLRSKQNRILQALLFVWKII